MMFKLTNHTNDLFNQFCTSVERDGVEDLGNWSLLFKNVWQWMLSDFDLQTTKPELGQTWIEFILAEMKILPEFKVMHKSADNDPWATKAFSRWLALELIRAIPRPQWGLIRSESEVKMEIQGMQSLASQIGTNVLQTKLATLSNALEQLESRATDFQAALVRKATNVRDAIRSACEKARADIKKMQDMEAIMGGGWGKGRTPGAGLTVQAKDDLEKRLLNDNSLRQVLMMAGRMKRVSDQVQATRTDAEHGSPVGVETGADTKRLLPTELAQMMMGGNAELNFYRKFTTKSLLQYKCKDKVPQGKGPIVLCVDESGSMRGNGREEWARAVGYVLCLLAEENNRSFQIIGFNKNIVYQESPSTLDGSLMKWAARHFTGGGTDIEKPLRKGIEIIESDLPDADIVVITDDEFGITEKFKNWFFEKRNSIQFKLISILLGAGTSGSLNTISNICSRVDDLSIETQSADAASIAFHV